MNKDWTGPKILLYLLICLLITIEGIRAYENFSKNKTAPESNPTAREASPDDWLLEVSRKEQIGRYTIIQSKIDRHSGILKLDTATGKTWHYMSVSVESGQGPDQIAEGWYPILDLMQTLKNTNSSNVAKTNNWGDKSVHK